MEIQWAWYLVIGVVLMIMEIFAPGFILFPAGIAFLANAAFAYFVTDFMVQLISLIVLLIVVFFFSRRFMKMQASKNTLQTGADAFLGKIGIVEEAIDPLGKPGSVRVEGEVWKARSGSNTMIESGKKVLVMRVDGIALVVVESKE